MINIAYLTKPYPGIHMLKYVANDNVEMSLDDHIEYLYAILGVK